LKAEEIKGKNRIQPLKFPLRETPHLTIEPNRTCNIHCRYCYTLNKDYIKSLATIKKEIDLALSKRRLETISLVGGEPTLHPHLTEIIHYIKSKKIKSQLLTNGILMLNQENDCLLDELIKADLDRILLHVDSGQNHVHQDIELVRDTLFKKMERKKIHFALSITISEEERGKIPKLIRQYAKYKYFDGILAVLAKNSLNSPNNTKLEEEYETILSELKLEPSAYIPSNLEDDHLSWLIYYYFINSSTGETFGISPSIDKTMRKLYRIIKRKNLFSPIIKPIEVPYLSLLIFFLDSIQQPRQAISFFKLIKKSSFLRALRIHFVAIQEPPGFNLEKNHYQFCFHCPDATIRKGKLTPVCLADLINPFNGEDFIGEDYKNLYQEVYSHLKEL